ncbi:MAG: DUF2809 domain-containing protein [Oscillospiraceae bacterium]
MSKKSQRLLYIAAFAVFLLIEVCIALFVHDRFVRPYIGDVLAVITVYCAARAVFPDRFWLAPAVLLLAAAVELIQLTDISAMFPEGGIIATVLGSTFDAADLICYTVGAAVCLVWDIFILRKRSCKQRREKNDKL